MGVLQLYQRGAVESVTELQDVGHTVSVASCGGTEVDDHPRYPSTAVPDRLLRPSTSTNSTGGMWCVLHVSIPEFGTELDLRHPGPCHAGNPQLLLRGLQRGLKLWATVQSRIHPELIGRSHQSGDGPFDDEGAIWVRLDLLLSNYKCR
jgi:hypothetical protein